MSRLRIDYKTLVAAIGVIVSMAVLLVVLDSIDARRESARSIAAKDRQIAIRDEALVRAQAAADDAATQSRANGEQINLLITQIDKQTTLLHQQDGIVMALRDALSDEGVTTVIKDGKVTIVKGSSKPPSTAANTKPPALDGPGKAPSSAPPPSTGGGASQPVNPTPGPVAETLTNSLAALLDVDPLCTALVCIR